MNFFSHLILHLRDNLTTENTMVSTRDVSLLERICFNYEDDMVDEMVRFANEVKNRRERYCRERRELFDRQQQQMQNMSPARRGEGFLSSTRDRDREPFSRTNIFNEQIRGTEGMSMFDGTSDGQGEATSNRNDNDGLRGDMQRNILDETIRSIPRDNTPDLSHPSNRSGNDNVPVPPSTPPPPFQRVTYGQGDRQACTPRATSSPQRNADPSSHQPPDASSLSNPQAQTTVPSLQQPHSHPGHHSDATRVIQNPGVQIIRCTEMSCPRCFYVFQLCAKLREGDSGAMTASGTGTCPTSTGQCSDSACPTNTNTSGGTGSNRQAQGGGTNSSGSGNAGQNSGTNSSGSAGQNSGGAGQNSGGAGQNSDGAGQNSGPNQSGCANPSSGHSSGPRPDPASSSDPNARNQRQGDNNSESSAASTLVHYNTFVPPRNPPIQVSNRHNATI